MAWKQGDRVQVRLPDKSGQYGPAGKHHWFTGTVREVDSPGKPHGVRVVLDQRVNGLRWCFATHEELNPADEAPKPEGD